MKISAKMNTLQNINIYFCSFAVLNELKECLVNCGMVWFPTGHYWHCNWPVQKASSRNVYVQMVDIWTPFVKNSCKKIAFFHVFWFKWLLSIVPDFYWWSIGLCCLTARLKLVHGNPCSSVAWQPARVPVPVSGTRCYCTGTRARAWYQHGFREPARVPGTRAGITYCAADLLRLCKRSRSATVQPEIIRYGHQLY